LSKSGGKGWTNYIQLQKVGKGREGKREKGWSGERAGMGLPMDFYG